MIIIDGIIFNINKDERPPMGDKKEELRGHHGSLNKPVTDGAIVCNSTYTRFQKQSKSQR